MLGNIAGSPSPLDSHTCYLILENYTKKLRGVLALAPHASSSRRNLG
jgi:hypothetical protein